MNIVLISTPFYIYIYILYLYLLFLTTLDIRKLKAALAAPLDFGDGGNDGDTASEVSAPQAPKKVKFTIDLY